MRIVRRLLLILIILLTMSAALVWWNRPRRVDMATFVPADALLYLEANSLPQLVGGLTQTDGWHNLAGPAGLNSRVGYVGWLGRLASWTGIGPADTIVYARMQVALVVLGVTAADGGETLTVKPRVALIVETHSNSGRALATIEKHVGKFAVRAYDDLRIDKMYSDGARWIIWSSPSTDRRIIAAITGSVAIIGNDETAVKACLAVRRGDRPSLAGNFELEDARRRLSNDESLAFGFISSRGSANLMELATAIYMGQVSEDQTTQSIAANVLPQIATKIVGSIGWSTRLVKGAIEDSYFISITNDAAARLRGSLAFAAQTSLPAFSFLPSDIYSVTRYSTRDALTSWRALSFSISSQLDPVLAVLVAPLLKATLRPYGIDEPDLFLHSVGPDVLTSRIEKDESTSVLIVEVRDEKTLRNIVVKRLGLTIPQVERVGDTEILASTDVSRGAASFVGEYLLLGTTDNVRRCLLARSRTQTLNESDTFQASLARASLAGPYHVLTLTKDSIPAREFIGYVARQPTTPGQPINNRELDMKIEQLPFAFSEMNFVEGGIERKTWSTFGLLGVLVTQFEAKK